jgi:hypothetical protein
VADGATATPRNSLGTSATASPVEDERQERAAHSAATMTNPQIGFCMEAVASLLVIPPRR